MKVIFLDLKDWKSIRLKKKEVKGGICYRSETLGHIVLRPLTIFEWIGEHKRKIPFLDCLL